MRSECSVFAEYAFGILFTWHNNREMYCGPSLKFQNTIDEVKQNISAGILLMISNWSALLLTGGARLIIQWHWSKITFGKVSFSFSITNLFLTFVSAISVVLFPSLKRIDKQNLPELYRKIRNIMNPLLIMILVFYYPGCWILKVWLPTYSDSLNYLGILLPIIIFSSKINLLTNNYLKALRKEKTMLIINLFSLVVAMCMFLISAYMADNLKMLLCSIVVALAVCSVLAETVVMKTLKIFDMRNFAGEIVMTVVFVVTTMLTSQMIGMLIYAIAIMVYILLNRVVFD